MRGFGIIPAIPRVHTRRQSKSNEEDNTVYKLIVPLQDPLRRRFGNALQFYHCLKDSVVIALDKITTSVRSPDEAGTDTQDQEDAPHVDTAESDAEESPFMASPLAQPVRSTPRNREKRRRCEVDEDEDYDGSPFPDPPERVRPSEYLRARCPCCFGGVFPREGLQG